MLKASQFKELEALYSAYRPVTPSLSNNRPSNSKIKYPAQSTGRVPNYDFRKDSLELYGLKPKGYQQLDDKSDQDDTSNSSSNMESMSFQPKWKDWILEKQTGYEKVEIDLDEAEYMGEEEYFDEVFDNCGTRYMELNVHNEYNFETPQEQYEDCNESQTKDNILGSIKKNIQRPQSSPKKTKLNIDNIFNKREHTEEISGFIPGTYPKYLLHIPVSISKHKNKIRSNDSTSGVSDGPIFYLKKALLIPSVIKLVFFMIYYMVTLQTADYSFNDVSRDSKYMLFGLDKIILGLEGFIVAQHLLPHVINFPVECNNRYHLLKYAIKIVRDATTESIWNEYEIMLTNLHKLAMDEFQNKIFKKLVFMSLTLIGYIILSGIFLGWIYIITNTSSDVGKCFNIIFFGKTQTSALVFCLIAQGCSNAISYFTDFVSEYGEETIELLMKKLDYCKNLKNQKGQRIQILYQDQQRIDNDKKSTYSSRESDSFSKLKKSNVEDTEVLLISTPEGPSYIIYHPQTHASPLNARSEANTGSLHLVDPISPPDNSLLSIEKSALDKTTHVSSDLIRFKKHSYIRTFLRFLIKIPFKLILMSGRATLNLLSWRLNISLTSE